MDTEMGGMEGLGGEIKTFTNESDGLNIPIDQKAIVVERNMIRKENMRRLLRDVVMAQNWGDITAIQEAISAKYGDCTFNTWVNREIYPICNALRALTHVDGFKIMDNLFEQAKIKYPDDAKYVDRTLFEKRFVGDTTHFYSNMMSVFPDSKAILLNAFIEARRVRNPGNEALVIGGGEDEVNLEDELQDSIGPKKNRRSRKKKKSRANGDGLLVPEQRDIEDHV